MNEYGEPWAFGALNPDTVCNGPYGTKIHEPRIDGRPEFSMTDLQRIVACVNLLADFSTEDIELLNRHRDLLAGAMCEITEAIPWAKVEEVPCRST